MCHLSAGERLEVVPLMDSSDSSSEEPPPQLQLTSALGLRGDALAFIPNIAGFKCVRGQECVLDPSTQHRAWNRVGVIQKVLKGLRLEVRAEKLSLV